MPENGCGDERFYAIAARIEVVEKAVAAISHSDHEQQLQIEKGCVPPTREGDCERYEFSCYSNCENQTP
eukprot:10989693-Karenia_brevis.AAC.1